MIFLDSSSKGRRQNNQDNNQDMSLDDHDTLLPFGDKHLLVMNILHRGLRTNIITH